MSRSTISTFKLFELFPDEGSARRIEMKAPYDTEEQARQAAQQAANRTGWPQWVIVCGSGYDYLNADTPGLGSYSYLKIGKPIFKEL